jgi:hypothetical protein
MRRIVAGLIAAGTLAACGGIEQASVSSATRTGAASAASPTPSTPEATTPSPTSAPARVGDTITTTKGATFQVVSYVDHFSGGPYETPKPGQFYAAIQVHACAGSDGTLHVNPYDFYLIEPDDSHIEYGTGPFSDGKEPGLNDANLQPKECVTGWVNYGVTAKPKTVGMSDSDLRWQVS